MIFIINIEDDPFIMDRSNIRIINAGKSIIAFGKFFLCPCSGNDFATKYNGHSVGTVVGGKTQAVQQVGTGIGNSQVDGLLCTCDHHRTPVVLDQIGKGSCSVSHGICAMADHEAIIKFILFFNESRQLDPVLGAYIGTVQRKGLQCVNGAEGGCCRDIGEKFLCRDLRGKAVLGIFGCNGAACGDQ